MKKNILTATIALLLSTLLFFASRDTDCPSCIDKKVTLIRCTSCNGAKKITCPFCKGRRTGHCHGCNGSGDIYKTRVSPSGGSFAKTTSIKQRLNCPKCAGTGKLYDCTKCQGGRTACPACKGSGRARIACKSCDGDREVKMYRALALIYDSIFNGEKS